MRPKPFSPLRMASCRAARDLREGSLAASFSTFWVVMVSRVISAMVSPFLFIMYARQFSPILIEETMSLRKVSWGTKYTTPAIFPSAEYSGAATIMDSSPVILLIRGSET